MSFRQLQYRRGWNQWRRWFSDRQYSGERGHFVSGDSHFQSVEDANSGSRQGNDTFSHQSGLLTPCSNPIPPPPGTPYLQFHRPTPLTGNSHFMSPPNLNQSSQFHQPRSVSGNGQLMGSPNSYYVLSFSKSGLGEAEFSKFHSNVKRGDIVAVTGFPGKTKRGEPSIFPRSFELLSHCLHMMPRQKAGSETVNSKKSVWEPGSARIPEAYILKDQLINRSGAPPSRRLFPCSLHSSRIARRNSHFQFYSAYSSKAPCEESHNVKVGVFWDFNTCKLPTGINLTEVGPLVTSALEAEGIKGPVDIFTFGDASSFSTKNLDQMQKTDIHFYNVPKGEKKLLSKTVESVLLDWVLKNPPPGHLLIISGNRFTRAIFFEFKYDYNILTASIGATLSIITRSWKSKFRDVEIENSPTMVWWDFENCFVPPDLSILRVQPALEELCKKYKVPLPMEIRAVGHFSHFKVEDIEHMDESGISFHNIQSKEKNAADKFIRREIRSWMGTLSGGTDTRTLIVISGDIGFRKVLIEAADNNISTILLHNEQATTRLTREAGVSLMWEMIMRNKY